MMGRSHAVSGVAGWVGLCAAGSLAGADVAPSAVLIGAGVSAGFALLPDLDHPGSTVSRSLGPVTRLIGRTTSYVADKVQDWTCRCCKDPNTVAHRALTHTAVGALATGALVALAGARRGKRAARVVVFLAVALAVRGIVPTKWRGTFGAALAGAVAAALTAGLGPAAGWWWLGVPAGFGVLAHILGDGATKSAVPLLWPARIRGCRWYPCGSPRWLRFRTGGRRERWLVVPLMVVGLAGSVWVLAGMPS